MESTGIQWCKPDGRLPNIQTPFIVVIDSNDEEWRSRSFVEKTSQRLAEHGCLFFICFGQDSEALHDLLDDYLEGQGRLEVSTTFLVDESLDETVNLAVVLATTKKYGVLFLVRHQDLWSAHLLVEEIHQ